VITSDHIPVCREGHTMSLQICATVSARAVAIRTIENRGIVFLAMREKP